MPTNTRPYNRRMYVLTGPTVFVDAVDTRQWIDGARQVAVLPKNLDAYTHTHTNTHTHTHTHMRLVGQLLWRMTMKFRLSRKQTATTPNDDVKNVLHETKLDFR